MKLERMIWTAAAVAVLGFPFGTASAQTAAPVGSPQYVGGETCIACHQEHGAEIAKTIHGKVKEFELAVKEARGCEGCHGPGSLHVEAAGDKADPKFGTIKKISALGPTESANVCLSCHKQGPGMDWKGSAHSLSGDSCNACHDPHEGKGKLLKKEEPELCFSCHTEKKAQGKLPSHHPVAEGKMKCTSCHDPHSASNNNLKKASVNEVCYTCHMEKEGPWTFEHAPVAEDCGLCHNPHGTVNQTLLKRSQPFLCMQCHKMAHPQLPNQDSSTVSGMKSMKFTRCTTCHKQIHGTDVPSQNGHGFTR